MKKIKVVFDDGSIAEIDEADFANAEKAGAKRHVPTKGKAMVSFDDGSIVEIDQADTANAKKAGAVILPPEKKNEAVPTQSLGGTSPSPITDSTATPTDTTVSMAGTVKPQAVQPAQPTPEGWTAPDFAAIDKKATLFPKQYEQVLQAKDFATKNPSKAIDAFNSIKDFQRFSDKTVAKFNRDNGVYIDENGQPKTAFKEGDIVTDLPTDRPMNDGITYKSGFAQFINGAWKPAPEPPNPTFSADVNPLSDVVVQGYAKKQNPDSDADAAYNKAVSMMQKSDVAITEGEVQQATKMVIEGDDDPVYTAIENTRLAEGGKKLAPFLAIHKEILPQYRSILKAHPTYNASQEGSYTALNDAVTKTYELDKELWEPLNGDVNNYVDSAEYFSMAEKADPKKYNDVMGRMEVIKNAYDKETDPKKKNEYGNSYNALLSDAKKMEAERQSVMAYFEKPNVKLIIERAEKHRKGLGVQSYIGKLFPKRMENEETVFQKDHKQLSMLERILSYPHAIINGIGGGVNDVLNFLDETADTLSGIDTDAHTLRQRMNDTQANYLKANNHIQATDNEVGDFALGFLEMGGGIVPAFAFGGAGVVSKAAIAGYFGLGSAQAIQTEYFAKGIDAKTTALAATVNGSLMALATWGFGISEKFLSPKGGGFKPSFSTTQAILDPATREAGIKAYMTELGAFNNGQLIKSIPSNVWSAAKLRIAEQAHVYVNDVVNKVKGTDLNTESGGAEDFLSMAGSFLLMHGLTGMASKKKLTDADRMALAVEVGATNMKATMDALDALRTVKGVNKDTIREMKATLTAYAGIKMPKGITNGQRGLLFLEIENKKAFEQAANESEFKDYYLDKIKETDKRIKDILDNPEGATGKAKAMVDPIVADIKATANDPFGLKGISFISPEELAASQKETTTIEAKDTAPETKKSGVSVTLPESNKKPVEVTTVNGEEPIQADVPLETIDVPQPKPTPNETQQNSETKAEVATADSEVTQKGTESVSEGAGKAGSDELKMQNEIKQAQKPIVKLELLTSKQIVDTVDPVANKSKHDDIKERYKKLKALIECL